MWNSGSYSVSVICYAAQKDSIEIKLDGTSIKNSPFSIEVDSSIASANDSTASGSGLQGGIAGSNFFFIFFYLFFIYFQFPTI